MTARYPRKLRRNPTSRNSPHLRAILNKNVVTNDSARRFRSRMVSFSEGFGGLMLTIQSAAGVFVGRNLTAEVRGFPVGEGAHFQLGARWHPRLDQLQSHTT